MKTQASDYFVGLDIGTGSVGWVVMGQDYRLKRAKGKELIGARLFDAAETAEDRRMHRTTRRRLSRRRWRLHMLDDMFANEIFKVDSDFLVRRKYSWVHPADEVNQNNFYGGMIFPTRGGDREFYRAYPTIYHLRNTLTQDKRKHDIREVYLAIHHILKYRGNFLWNGDIKSSNLFNVEEFIESIVDLSQYVWGQSGISKDEVDSRSFSDAFLNPKFSRQRRVEEAMAAVSFSGSREILRWMKILFTAIAGNKFDVSKIFNYQDVDPETKKKLGLNFRDEDYDAKFNEAVDTGVLTEEDISQLLHIQDLYSQVTLRILLGPSSSISEAMVAKYNQHGRNWDFIKKNLRTALNHEEVNKNYLGYLGFEMVEGIRRPLKDSKTKEAARKKALTYFRNLIENIPEGEDRQKLLNDIEIDSLFPVQRMSDNGVIPHQLHLNELRLIIRNQSQYYPFLEKHFIKDGNEVNCLEGLLTFRIPYYVGPLVAPDEMQKKDDSSNHWMVRKDGSSEAITPWNFDSQVDRDASARKFIERLTGTDTYLLGEPTLPKKSLAYQEFEVLNELNNVRLSPRSEDTWDDRRREKLPIPVKKKILKDLFAKYQTVTKKRLEDYLRQEANGSYEIYGLSDENKFLSSLSTRKILSEQLGEDFVNSPANREVLEEIVKLQTVFEDKKSLSRQLHLLNIGVSDEQIEKMADKHYTGWGRLSAKLLMSPVIECKFDDEFSLTKHTLLDVMKNTDQNFMQIISDKKNGFGDWIDQQNSGIGKSGINEVIEDLACSPKVKRGVVQSLAVLKDIERAMGKAPAKVFLEFADDTQPSLRTQSRKSRLELLYKNVPLRGEFSRIRESLSKENGSALDDDRLYLYYLQAGKDMYTGDEINLDELSSHYDIDHIVPQAVTKDDSLDNRVLVSRTVNARKSDTYTYTTQLINERFGLWNTLFEMGLMSQKKFNALTNDRPFSENKKERFIARALVETRQIIKSVSNVIEDLFEGKTEAQGIRSQQTKDMRRFLGIDHKNRDINDYHHAQDALCITAVGIFIDRRGFFDNGEVSDGAKNSYNLYQADYLRKLRNEAVGKSNERLNPFGFVVGSMRSRNETLRVNPISGEIVWSEEDKKYLMKVANYRKMLVTKKVGDIEGALTDETRYGAQTAKGSRGVPFKKGMKTQLYGGFSGVKNVYTVLVSTESKNKLVNIPVSVMNQVKSSPNSELELKSYLDSVLKGETYRVLLSRVSAGQLIRFNGSLMTIKSATEFNSAEQVWLPQREYDALDLLLKETEENSIQRKLNRLDFPSADSAQKLCFDKLLEISQSRFADGFVVEEAKLEIAQEKFVSLSFSQRNSVLQRMVNAMHSGAGRADLKDIGLSGTWGRIKRTGVLDNEAVFIFQSPTGVFERTVTVKQLSEKAR